MELLILSRPILVSALFASLGGIGVGAYMDKQPVVAIAAVAAHLSLLHFTTTEAFGRIALARAKSARILARVFFGMYVLPGIGLALS
jgi:hypothetical protein